MTDFHFLHPLWLLALPLTALLAWWLWRQQRRRGSHEWAAYVDAHLLKVLAVSGQSGQQHARKSVWWLAGLLAAICTILAVAGPAWQRLKTPSFTGNLPTVLVLSLAQSMNSDDIKPSRLKRAEHKIRDLLAATKGDPRALVIYADTAFVASPLTNDAKIIEQMLPELSTNLMPVLGNRLDVAITEAVGLLQRGNAARGRIVVLADDVGNAPELTDKAAKAARATGYHVSVIGVGTAAGAALQTADGRAITQNGQALTSQLVEADLQRIAQLGGGEFALIAAGDTDVNRVLNNTQPEAGTDAQQELVSDTWQNQGYWLLLVPLLVLPWFFRRGMVFVLVLVAGSALMTPQPTWAQADAQGNATANKAASAPSSWWQNLWQTPNQQGQKAFEQQQYDTAAQRFDNTDWQATADYKAQNYQQAADNFQAAGQYYNAGNALAKAGDLTGALAAYENALKANPNDKNAEFNRDVVKKILDEQQKNQQQDGQDGEQQDGQQQDQQQKNQQDGQQGQQDSQQDDSQKNGQKNEQKTEQESEQDDSQNSEQQDAENNAPKDEQKDQSKDGKSSGSHEENNQQQGQQKDQAQNETNPSDLPQWDDNTKLEKQADEQSAESAEQMVAVPTQPLDQATEQQLRRVPDDPSGLLRHRIRQHYYRQGLGQ